MSSLFFVCGINCTLCFYQEHPTIVLGGGRSAGREGLGDRVEQEAHQEKREDGGADERDIWRQQPFGGTTKKGNANFFLSITIWV
jgi:hypothetical protein